MPRPSKHIPKYRLHKTSGRAVVTLPDGKGGRYDVRLGAYGSPESRMQYARAIAEWETNGRRRAMKAAGPAISINEVAEAYLAHAESYYRRPDGSSTTEVAETKLTIRRLRELYGLRPASEFTPQHLKTIREQMVAEDLSRGVVNQRIGRIRRIFKWGVAEGLVPVAVHQALECLADLPRGRGLARETEPIRPIPEVYVDAIRDFVLPEVWAMICIQKLTGMRPGEVVQMRAVDIERCGPVWQYRPASHKTQWRGRERVIAIGQRAQEIIRAHLTPRIDDYLFSPKRAVESRYARMREVRVSKVQPSQFCRRKKNPMKQPGEKYGAHEYAKAIAAGCKKADTAMREKAIEEATLNGTEPPGPEVVFVPHWSPNQLRHNFATLVRRQFGLEHAQVLLGHESANITQRYAERDQNLAISVAEKIG